MYIYIYNPCPIHIHIHIHIYVHCMLELHKGGGYESVGGWAGDVLRDRAISLIP